MRLGGEDSARRAHLSRKHTMHTRRTHGFTLIELLLVVAIVGVLAAIAIPKFSSTRQRGSRAAGVADMSNLIIQQERFYSETGRYGTIADSAALRLRISPRNTGLVITLAGAPAGTAGFSATVGFPGSQTCGVFVGTAPTPAGMPSSTTVSRPVCWP